MVVDDASSDATGDVVRAVSEEEPRVRVVRNDEPYRRPQGTLAPHPAGKPPQCAMPGQVSRGVHRRLEPH